MKKDNLFIRFKNSIYNTRKMAIYCKEGFGRALLYSLILCLFLGLIQSIYSAIDLNKTFNSVNDVLGDKKYNFQIQNGVLDIKTSPIKTEESGYLVYINDEISLDEVDKLNNIIVNADTYILILKDGIEMGSSNSNYDFPTQRITYAEGGLTNVDNKTLMASLEFTKIFVVIIMMVFRIVFTLAQYIVFAAIVAIFATLASVILRIKLKYSELISLVLYVETLPKIIVLIFSMIVPNVYFESIGLIGTLLYTILILREMKKDGIDKIV